MEFRILGPLEVVEEGRPLSLGGSKQRALLALLLLEANRPVSRNRLIDALWEEEPTTTAPKALHVYVSQLRKRLGHDRVQTQPGGYLLRADPDEVDLTRFQRLVDEGKPRDALALWRGAPLGEFANQPFAQADIGRLEEMYIACLEARLAADLDDGRHAEVVGELEALVQSHPLRERLRELLLLALYRSGRQADALAEYQAARTVLVDALGIEPSKALRDLHQAILRQDAILELGVDRQRGRPSRGPFVGRDRELDELVAGLGDAAAGRGRLFLLVGEPGIGKSRLAEELIQVARARRFDVLVGRCWEASGAPAFWPWVQSLREYAREAPPELAALLRGEPVADESESARFRLFDATAAFLRRSARDRPLVLFLDDMHAADEPSLLLLAFVAREIPTARVMIVAACRDADPVPGGPLASMLVDVAREPGTSRLSLHGLSEQAVADYVETQLASRELASALFESTDGNPLFLGETVRLLAVEGRIAIPPSLRDVIARRLAHLSEECNRVLVLAAVLGREFDHDALASMSDLSVDELLVTLDEAMTARVVTDVPGATERSRFAHVLIRDALYDGLTPARRVSLHRAAAAVLVDDAELAFHAMAGNDLEKALVCAQRAGVRALALLAYEEAARLYNVALAAKPDERTRCELLLGRGEAEMRAGGALAARETFVAAAEIARSLGLDRELARAAAGYGGLIVWSRAGDDKRLVPLLEEGLAALGDDEIELRVRLLARLAGALRDEHSRDRRDALSRQAVELARSAGNSAALAYALVGRAHAITAPDTINEFDELATDLSEAAAAVGDRERVEAGHVLRVMARHVLGDMDGAAADLDAASRIADELRQPVHLWEVLGIRATLAVSEGRFDEAEALIDGTLAAGEHALPEAAVAHHRMQRAALCEFRGGLEAMEPLLAALVTEQPARPLFACALAHAHALLERTSDAQLELAALTRDGVVRLPFDQEWLLGVALLAETCALVGDVAAAEALYSALLPWEALTAIDQSEGCRGSAARHLGLLATVLARWNDAERHFERALAANERMGFRPWLARTQQDYARLLRSRGDDERAAALEAAARATYEELGAAPV